MQTIVSRLRHSASFKVFTIGFLILVLLIPLGMIRGTINDRDQNNAAAIQDIQRAWGHNQLIAGPVLILPFESTVAEDSGQSFARRSAVYLLPAELDIDASLESEVRYRGIHKVPVYTSSIRLRGAFNPIDVDGLGIDGAEVLWDEASIAIGISDGRAIAETPALEVDGRSLPFIPGGQQIIGLPPQVIAPLGDFLSANAMSGFSFAVNLHIKGSESLSLLPLGDTTRASMQSPWPSPSFWGNYLPDTRLVEDTGFTAQWRISNIGRALPSHWARGSNAAEAAESSAFGVELYMPISIYRLTLRAATYGVLFVVLTFVSYFMFEVVAGLRLHPLQYLMVGLANVIFFLLLISLAEHIGFTASYLLSGIASVSLITGYSYSVLGDLRRAGIMAVILLVLYSFLYMTLIAESYALLAGSLGLWVALAMIMYLTRRIDWYRNEAS